MGFASVPDGALSTSAHDSKKLDRRPLLLPWIVLIIGVPASFFLFTIVSDAVEDVARLRFERQASDARRVIDVRVHSYADILYGLKALFASQGSIDRVQFHRFAQALELRSRYPSLESVNYMVYVPAAEKEAFEQSVRRDTSLDPRGYPEFAIRPEGKRPEYFVLVYLEPLAGFEFAFGRDLGANPAATDPQGVAAAVRLTRDSGQLTASGLPLRMKSRDRAYTGLAMRLGVYRAEMPTDTVEQRQAAFLGSVGAGFNVDDLMQGVLDKDVTRQMRFMLYDVGSASEPTTPAALPNKERLLFDSGSGHELPLATTQPTDIFTRILPIEIGGRVWQLQFTAPKRSVIDPVDFLMPRMVLLGGLISTVLLAGLFYSLASSRSRAEAMASEITKDLSKSEASLAQAQRMAHLGNWSLDLADWTMTWSAETWRIFALEPSAQRVPFQHFLQQVHEEDRLRVEQALLGAITAREQRELEHRILAGDGNTRWVHTIVQATSYQPDAPIPGTMMDISDRKRAEQDLRSSAEQLTALSRRLVEVQEAERRQLSRELHDRVGQNLTALSINLDILRTSLPGEERAEIRSRLRDSSALLESTVDSIEDVMAELRPPMLDDYGLLPALHWYTKDFSKRTGIEVEVAGSERAERVPPEVEIALFRIAQEALTNVAKHAHAKRVRVEFDQASRHCAMLVADDGIGIGAVPRERRGLGMVTMRERAQAIGGRFEVRTAPGGGTQIAIDVGSHGDTRPHRG